MKNYFAIFLLCWSATFGAEGQQLEFIRENVVFKLDTAHLKVTADLWFRNPHSQVVTQTIHIPFACEGSDYITDSILVMDCSSNTMLKPFRKNIAGALIQVTVDPKDQKQIKIVYIQNHDRKRSGYILTKVKYWNKPITEANYTLLVESKAIHIDSTSFKPDVISDDHGKMKQTWRKSNFMPTKELCFYFHLE
jgi:hypothetical protein